MAHRADRLAGSSRKPDSCAKLQLITQLLQAGSALALSPNHERPGRMLRSYLSKRMKKQIKSFLSGQSAHGHNQFPIHTAIAESKDGRCTGRVRYHAPLSLDVRRKK